MVFQQRTSLSLKTKSLRSSIALKSTSLLPARPGQPIPSREMSSPTCRFPHPSAPPPSFSSICSTLLCSISPSFRKRSFASSNSPPPQLRLRSLALHHVSSSSPTPPRPSITTASTITLTSKASARPKVQTASAISPRSFFFSSTTRTVK